MIFLHQLFNYSKIREIAKTKENLVNNLQMSYLMRLTLHGGKNREVLMTGTIVQIDGGHAPVQRITTLDDDRSSSHMFRK